MEFSDLTPDLREKVKACKTSEELLELAKSEGYELSDEDMEAISGGSGWDCALDCSKDDCGPFYRVP